MDSHENARTTPHGRMLIVERLAAGQSVGAVAAAMGLTPKTVRKWGTVRNFVWDRDDQWLVKRSSKRMANCAFAAVHSLAGILHSFAARFKTRNSSFSTASWWGKWPRVRTARRSLACAASIALVV